MIEVPKEFMVSSDQRFPLHQGISIDERAYQWFKNKEVKTDRVYVPISWYGYQINSNYGKDTKKMLALKKFVFGLPTNRDYWTITQYSDGVLGYNKFFPLKNWRIFGAGGCGTDAIPLTCDRHPFRGGEKKILCSFLGSLNTHGIRYIMNDVLNGIPGFHIEEVNTRTSDYQPLYKKFLGITEKSYFVLCPRGYGSTSFRLYEAMQLGCVPVYVSDEHWLPFQQYVDWRGFAVVIRPDEIRGLPDMLKAIMDSGKYADMRKTAIETYEKYFTYEGCFRTIKRMLEDEHHKG